MTTATQFIRLIGCIVLISCLTSLWAQELTYTSGPTRSYTFSRAPSSNLFFNGTEFEWIASRGDHRGLAYFDGVNDSVNLWSYPDDNGLYFPSNIGQRSFSIEVWAQFIEMQSYSRLFETSTIWGAGDNIVIMCVGTTGNLGIRVYSGTSNVGTDLSRAITPNTWQHVVLVGDQISLSDSTSSTAANYSVYINGARIGGYVGNLPRDVFRGIANLGRSSYVTSTDNLFYRGFIDDFYWYNYQLQDQQVAAHFVCRRPAVFDIAFAENPSQISGITNPTYGFILSDPVDVAAGMESYRKGLVTFDGTSQFVDLATNTGSNSIGTTVPTLGGNGFGADGNMTNGYAPGWSFECLVKFTQITNNGRVYYFSDGGANEIFLGFSGSSNTLLFSVSTNSIPVNIAVMENTAVDTWMHIVVTISRTTSRFGVVSIFFNVFINGQFVRSATGVWPAAVTRSTAYLARNGNSYLGMKLDSMRIFDFALGNSTISNLYITTHSPLPVDVTNATSIDMYSTSPIALYGFDDETRMSNFSNFRWLNKSGEVNGIAIFEGTWNHFIDLQTFSDDYERFLPLTFGGEMTFEAHVQYFSLASWSRIFDFGGALGFNDNNVYIALQGTTANLNGAVYGGSSSSAVVSSDAVKVGIWQHIVMTVEQVNFADPYTSTSAMTKIYVDGVLRSSGLTYLPSIVRRPNVWLARSNWVADSRFRGMMDFFAFYRYALSPQQIAAHAAVNEPPVFEVAFNKDPRVVMSGSTTGYGYNYLEIDPTNTGGFQHSGILDFSSASSQYLDLTTYQSTNGVGTILPTLGGSSGFDTSIGMTFELLIKFKSYDVGASVFDFGAGTTDRIRLTLRSEGLEFAVTNSVSGGSSTFVVTSAAAANVWYHVIIILYSNGDNTAYSVAYVNGNFVTSSTITYPANVNRTVAYIARNQEGVYTNMYLDAMRIYGYAITEDMARNLFVVTNDVPQENLGTPIYSTKPTNFWGFENPWPDTIQALYQYYQEVDGRTGVSYFNGLTSFANLGTYTDSYGNSASSNFGGPLTFQTWLRLSENTATMRIFDFSNGVDANSLNLVVGSGNSLVFTIYGVDTTQITTLSTPTNTFTVDSWFHLAIIVAQYAPSDSTSTTSAIVTIYINGAIVATGRMQLPQVVQRTTNYIGRGVASTSVRFHGYMDSFAIYNYPVQPESLKVHMISARLPVFELDFARDPRPLVNLSLDASYSWVAEDTPASFHKGMLVLDKNYVQYVNLRTLHGSNTLGLIVPPIGGHFSDTFDYTSGLSISISFKVRTIGLDSVLCWFGNNGGALQDHIVLRFTNGGKTLILEASSTRLSQVSTLTVIEGVSAGVWYDVVISMQPSNNQWTRSTWSAFVNAKKIRTQNNMVYPQQLTRQVARLGGNSTTDAFDGFIDSFRIFDHTVQLSAIQNMYGLTTDLAGSGIYNLGCGQYGTIRSGSLLISFILQGDIASLDSSFGSKIENALRRALNLRVSMVGCHSAVGSSGRVSLEASPSGAQTLVRTYLFSESRQTAPNVSYANFQLLAANGSLSMSLAQYGLPSVLPNSWSILPTCADGSLGDCGNGSSGSSLSGGAIAGIVIGVVVGVILFVIIAVYVMRRRSNGKSYTTDTHKTSDWESQRDDEQASETADDEGNIEMN